ncbi:hypothetical protein ABIB40_004113 [Pedobacter sp. UYP30]|uniref:carboxypeptidase-like regulatory domain-containing protein n=1 Tax=Pedobacter sp. UYP30 TaxID=1756400 RepID=UPI003393A6F4
MKHLTRLLFILTVFISANALAQEAYTISGIVINKKQEPIKNATVFISGSKKITATDANGRFTFDGMTAGNYQISTKMLGYDAPAQAITIHDRSVSITISLSAKSITLNEVNIGTDKNRERFYNMFKTQFLGGSKDAKNCTILNPETIDFSSKGVGPDDILLKANASDLLIIKNEQLGYKIKYLLRSFEYNSKTHITFYDGDTNFEEMAGTDEQKKVWATNRLAAYNGSLMHFLRSVYSNTVLNEGFIANQMVKSRNSFDPKIYMIPTPVKFDTLVTKIDTSFISFKFTALNIVYNPKEVVRLKDKELKIQKQTNHTTAEKPSGKDALVNITEIKKSSQLFLYLKEAVIDARGSVSTGYKTFLIRGNWANKRIGEQLPFEYLPPKLTLTIN